MLNKSFSTKPHTVIFVLLYIHYLNLKVDNMKFKKRKEGSFHQESKEEVGSAEVGMDNSTKNDGKRGKEDLGENFRKKYHEFQLERTKFLSQFHSFIETPILFTSDFYLSSGKHQRMGFRGSHK